MADASGGITGTITYDGNPLPGVAVGVDSPHLTLRYTTGDVDGNYSFSGLPADTYSVRFEMEAMSTVTLTVVVAAGTTARADAVMTLAPFPT
jgi:hypothetical protein